MNLAEMLGYADIGQLTTIAAVYDCECNSHSKNELIQSILATISSKESVRKQIRSMSVEELRFVNSLLFDTQQAFSLEELTARAQQSRFESSAEPAIELRAEPAKTRLPTAKSKSRKVKQKPAPEYSPRDTIVKFKQSGWLFNGFTGPNRYLFHVPLDLKQKFGDELARQFRGSLQYIDEPDAFRDEQNLLAEDLLQVLHYIKHHEVQLNAEGVMYKRLVQQLADKLHVSEQLPVKGALRFGYGRRFKDYPNRLSLLYDYGFYNGHFVEQEGRLTLSATGEQLLELHACEQPTLLYRFWLRLYKGPIPNLLSIVNWIDRLANNWVTTQSLEAALLPFIKPYYFDSALAIFQQRIVGMMMHLGLIRIGEHHQLGQVIRMTKVGHAVIAGVYVAEHDHIRLD